MNFFDKLKKDELEHISTGTNRVFRFELDGRKYILKINTQDVLGSFWLQQSELYGSCYETYIKELDVLYEVISSNPFISTPRLYEYSESKRYQIFECVEGKNWEPDEFPNNINIARILGKYIGTFHQTEYTGYGTVGNHNRTDFKKHFFETCRKQIETYWDNDSEKFEQLAEYESRFKNCNTFSLIMTDISGNQFIYNDDYSSILYNIDLDAYVIGPRELELIIIKDCLSNEAFEVFKEEYEKITKKSFPSFDNEEIYRFYFSLNDIPREMKEGKRI